MSYPITRRLPCSVCGLDTLRRDGWFLVVENRWLDRLRILTWHASLAATQGYKSACGRQHLKVLIGHWLEKASLRLVPRMEEPLPITSDPCQVDVGLTPLAASHLVGELSVYRETFSRVWTGSPATLESIVDALFPQDKAEKSIPHAFQLFRPATERPYDVSFR